MVFMTWNIKDYGDNKMSSNATTLGTFCTGCVTAAIVIMAIATLATISWVLLL